jgi:hypothetical protein
MLLACDRVVADGDGISDNYSTFVISPISDLKVLPNTPLPSNLISSTIEVNACRGEYEPASFILKAFKPLNKLKITITDLKGENSALPADIVDIRVVKCWYQAGLKIYDVNKRVLTPELLLKDDHLVRVDDSNKNNYLYQTSQPGETPYILISGDNSIDLSNLKPEDAVTLQPVDIEAGYNKQFWITIRVPDHAPSGSYKGKLLLTADNIPPKEMSLNLRVLPFELEKSILQYGLYYRGKLAPYVAEDYRFRELKDNKALVNSNWKVPAQYSAELKNMKAHGVEYPTIYQNNEKLLSQELILRKMAGLPMDSLYSLGVQTGSSTIASELAIRRDILKKWFAIAAGHEVRDFYVYGKDEAKGEELISQRIAWGAVKEAGGRVFAAIPKGSALIMGDLIDTAIVPGSPDSKEAKAYHDLGRKIYCYSNPQVGEETPETYRRNYGLLLWEAGYDGVMNYAYQHAANHIWNDFDHPKYRDHVFAYPTINGVIDTLAFEGFREAVDDVRYLTTLQSAVVDVRKQKPVEAENAERWINSIEPESDLQSIRAECISWILKLQSINAPDKDVNIPVKINNVQIKTD